MKILKPRKAPIKVISIGNISFGGTGKTPLAIEVINFLLRKEKKVCFVSRGYKGKWEKSGGVLSDGKEIFGTWKEAGDEAFSVAQRLPEAGVLVGKNRFKSCKKAAELGFEIAILDDGFQHRKLFRDIDVVLLSGERDFVLREFPSSLQRADILLLNKNTKSPYPFLRKIKTKSPHISLYRYRVIPQGIFSLGENVSVPPDHFKDKNILAFCGIANPKRFFSLLNEMKIYPAKTLTYPDHHPYPSSSIKKIIKTARREGSSSFITTEKDAVKIKHTVLSSDHPSYYLKIQMDMPEDFYKLLWLKLENIQGKDHDL